MKRIFIAAVLVSAMMSSCAKNEVTETYATGIDNPNLITLEVGTAVTRGADTKATNLSDVTLYSSAIKDGGSVSFTDGTSTTNWSAVDFTSAATFYGMQYGTTSVDAADGDAAITALTGDEDLVYFGSTLTVMPSGGTITAPFSHALSKVNIYTSNGEDKFTTNYASAVIKTVVLNGTATITPAVASTSTPQSVAWTAPATAADLTYFTATTGTAITSQITTDAGNANKYIVPQTMTAGSITANASDEDATEAVVTGSYIEVIYQVINADKTYYMGAAKGSAASMYNSDEDSQYAETPLFVKVGFPFAGTEAFAAGTSYAINLNVAEYAGSYISSNYCTADGTDTGIEIQYVEPGDSGVEDPKETVMKIDVSIVDWATGAAVPMNAPTEE